jgi:hypothetical protein
MHSLERSIVPAFMKNTLLRPAFRIGGEMMADRNVWDPPTKPGYKNFESNAYVVELYVYMLGQTTKTSDEVRKHVEEAAKVWCQAKINIQVVHLDKLAAQADFNRPLDLSVGDIARDFPCGYDKNEQRAQLYSAIRDQFFSIARNLGVDLTRSIAVFYISGKQFMDGAIGCSIANTRTKPDPKAEQVILLTDEANGTALAHELGHCLFERYDDVANNWTRSDPDPKGNGPHNTDKKNLMYPAAPDHGIISTEQAAVARTSLLVTLRPLVYGFAQDVPYKLSVLFHSMQVFSVSDEYSTEDLETKWTFLARVKAASGNVKDTRSTDWAQDPLEARPEPYEINQSVGPLQLAGADELVIMASGIDEDDFWNPDDDLAPIIESYRNDQSIWGSQTVTLPPIDPSDPNKTGIHFAHAQNDEISYKLRYDIGLEEAPLTTIFRTLC